MAFKSVVFVCAQLFFVKMISGQCLLNAGNAVLGNSLLNAAYAPAAVAPAIGCGAAIAPAVLAPAALAPAAIGLGNYAATSGGAFGVSSASALAPSGVSVLSENAIEGLVGVAGTLPFVGAVALEGAVPSAGAGAVSYSCGNGITEILAEDIVSGALLAPAAGILPATGLGLGLNNLGAAELAVGAGLGLNGLNVAGLGLNAGLGYGVAPAFGGCGRGLLY